MKEQAMDEHDEPRGWTHTENFRQPCQACGDLAIVCCGDRVEGWWCVDCCEHPFDELAKELGDAE